MELKKFYRNVEEIIISDVITYLRKNNMTQKFEILNIDISESITNENVDIIKNNNVTTVKINPNNFINKSDEYHNLFNGNKFNIVNCRFTLKYFTKTINTMSKFIAFISDVLEKDGVMFGYLFDLNNINAKFLKNSVISSGKNKIEYNGDDIDDEFIKLTINDENIKIIKSHEFENICNNFNLFLQDRIILKNIHKNSLNHIKLNKNEQKLGFLNYIFIMRKI